MLFFLNVLFHKFLLTHVIVFGLKQGSPLRCASGVKYAVVLLFRKGQPRDMQIRKKCNFAVILWQVYDFPVYSELLLESNDIAVQSSLRFHEAVTAYYTWKIYTFKCHRHLIKSTLHRQMQSYLNYIVPVISHRFTWTELPISSILFFGHTLCMILMVIVLALTTCFCCTRRVKVSCHSYAVTVKMICIYIDFFFELREFKLKCWHLGSVAIWLLLNLGWSSLKYLPGKSLSWLTGKSDSQHFTLLRFVTLART